MIIYWEILIKGKNFLNVFKKILVSVKWRVWSVDCRIGVKCGLRVKNVDCRFGLGCLKCG